MAKYKRRKVWNEARDRRCFGELCKTAPEKKWNGDDMIWLFAFPSKSNCSFSRDLQTFNGHTAEAWANFMIFNTTYYKIINKEGKMFWK